MMKKLYISVVLLVMVVSVAAQHQQSYDMNYYKSHAFLQQGDELCVMDADLEWPLIVDGRSAVPLQEYLSQLLIGTVAHDADALFTQLKSQYGEPVTGPFATLPDDDKYCYVDVSVEVMDYVPNHFISFAVKKNVKPAKKSSREAVKEFRLLTYDIQRETVMSREDLLKKSMLGTGTKVEELVPLALDEYGEYDIVGHVEEACRVQTGLYVRALAYIYEEAYDGWQWYTITGALSTKVSKILMSKAGRQLSESKPSAEPLLTFAPDSLWKGEKIYLQPEEKPVYANGNNTLAPFFVSNMHVTSPEWDHQKNGTSRLAFIVDKEGFPCDFHIISPLTPHQDREVVRVARLMSRWTPAKQGGQPVNSRFTLPVSFQDVE